jgi:DNA-directed RNA polymerase subunit beta'
VLEDIIRDHPVLLNRAPTLHRLGIQAFEPVLVEGKAIRVHPLVCAAFNADFDGDQMAVHVPLSFEAQLEARVLMLSSNNVLLPSNGRPVASPTQDMVIGAFYLTKAPQRCSAWRRVNSPTPPWGRRPGPRPRSSGRDLCRRAPLQHLRRGGDGPRPRTAWTSMTCAGTGSPGCTGRGGHPTHKWVRTTVGRVLFNSIIPDEMGFLNYTFGKRELGDLVFDTFTGVGLGRTTEFLDGLKDFGFRYATMGGVSVGIDDLEVPPEKIEILREAEEQVNRFQRAYSAGFISNGERYNKVIDTWTHANNDVADAMVRRLERSKDGFNPVFMMMVSGARGNRDQMRQLAGMRGLMAKPQKKLTGGIGEIIESPIKSNFREGLTVVEYFISTHGARKGLADTALKTADAGYLTRRLVDVAQDVTITEEDCGTILGLEMTALKEGEDIIEPLKDRIVGNVALEAVVDPLDGRAHRGGRGDPTRPPPTPSRRRGSRWFGSGPSSPVRPPGRLPGVLRPEPGHHADRVDIGEAVGILAAQSIGEPGTQLTLRTFHIGGTAARIAAQTQRKSKIDGWSASSG